MHDHNTTFHGESPGADASLANVQLPKNQVTEISFDNNPVRI